MMAQVAADTGMFLVAATWEKEGARRIHDRLLEGWKVVGITSASNSGGVWAMLVKP